MESVTEYDCSECQKDGNPAFRIPGGFEMLRKHVAIAHFGGNKSYLTHHCNDCKNAFYDEDHFGKHLNRSKTCKATSMKITPLSGQCEVALTHLVKMIGLPVQVAPQSPRPPASNTSALMPVALAIKEEPVINLADSDNEDNDRRVTSQILSMPPPVSTPSTEVCEDISSTVDSPMDENVSKRIPKKRGRKPTKGKAAAMAQVTPKPSLGVSTAKSPAKSTRSQTKAVEEPVTGPKGRKSDGATTKTVTPTKARKEVDEEQPIVDGPRNRRPVSYAEDDSEDDDEEEEEDNSDDEEWNSGKENDDDSGADEDEEADDKAEDEALTNLLKQCQLCVELKNNRPPIYNRREKEAHALIHLKFAPTFSQLTDDEAKKSPKFTKVMRMCFQDGFYQELKRKEQQDENMDTTEPQE